MAVNGKAVDLFAIEAYGAVGIRMWWDPDPTWPIEQAVPVHLSVREARCLPRVSEHAPQHFKTSVPFSNGVPRVDESESCMYVVVQSIRRRAC